MPRKKKPQSTLFPETIAGIRAVHPAWMPCKKGIRMNLFKFDAHVKEGKCVECIRWWEQAQAETELIRYLRDSRN